MEDVALSRTLRRRRPAGLPRVARPHVGAALGPRRRLAHDPADVVAALRVLARCRSRAAREGLRRPVPRRRVLQVFAKAPVPGEVKTRLARDARQRRGHRRVSRTGRAHARDGRVRLARAASSSRSNCGVRPTSRTRALADDVARAHGATLQPQHGADLGARMRAALAGARPRASALLIGTDCPAIDADYLAAAAAALATTTPCSVRSRTAATCWSVSRATSTRSRASRGARRRHGRDARAARRAGALGGTPDAVGRRQPADLSGRALAPRRAREPHDAARHRRSRQPLVAAAALAALVVAPARADDAGGDRRRRVLACRRGPRCPPAGRRSRSAGSTATRATRSSATDRGTVVERTPTRRRPGSSASSTSDANVRARWSWKVERPSRTATSRASRATTTPRASTSRSARARAALAGRARRTRGARAVRRRRAGRRSHLHLGFAAPPGTTVPNPYTDRVRMIVVESGARVSAGGSPTSETSWPTIARRSARTRRRCRASRS